MELATGIEKRDGHFAATAIAVRGGQRRIPAGELATDGLPRIGRSRCRIETTFEDWNPAPFGEYAAGLGVGLPSEIDARHAVWTFKVKRTRVLLPALALMRALFRPAPVIFPYLFRPQSIESICTLVASDPPRVAITIPWVNSRSRALETIVQPLSWMYCFRSGRSAWNSVFLAAQSGRLAMELPQGQSRLVLQGERQGRTSTHGQTLFVTHVTALELIAHDVPFEFAEGHPSRVKFFAERGPDPSRDTHMPTREASIPLRNGVADLSDEEWEAVGPMLFAARSARRRKHDPRALLDGLLRKLCFGTAWKQTPYEVGTWADASSLLRRLQDRGTWASACERLVALRANT